MNEESTFLFETAELKDLVELLSLNFLAPKRAVKQVSPHVFAIKINGHTGVAIGHSLASDLDIERCLNFLTETTLCYWWIDATQEDLAARLETKEFRRNIPVALMKADIHHVETYPPLNNIKIKHAETPTEKDLCIGIISSCFGVSKTDKKEWIDYLESNLDNKHCYLYLAYWQDTPAAVSLALHQGNQLILDEVCVLPHFRNKGLGFAISHHALEEGSKHGMTTALLGATDAGGSIYQKLGFKKAGLYRYYDFPNKNL